VTSAAHPRTLPDLCAQNAVLAGEQVAVLNDHGGKLSYAALHADALALARGLRHLDVKKKTRPDRQQQLPKPTLREPTVNEPRRRLSRLASSTVRSTSTRRGVRPCSRT